AMMELGATVCRARTPACDACPVAPCRSRQLGAPAAGDDRGAAARDGSARSEKTRAGRAPTRSVRARARRARTPFERTDRYVRGRIVAALVGGARAAQLVAGDALPEGIASERVERALA